MFVHINKYGKKLSSMSSADGSFKKKMGYKISCMKIGKCFCWVLLLTLSFQDLNAQDRWQYCPQFWTSSSVSILITCPLRSILRVTRVWSSSICIGPQSGGFLWGLPTKVQYAFTYFILWPLAIHIFSYLASRSNARWTVTNCRVPRLVISYYDM
jgi:hypothetical protein